MKKRIFIITILSIAMLTACNEKAQKQMTFRKMDKIKSRQKN